MTLDRRTFSLAALGALAASPSAAQYESPAECQRVREAHGWRARVWAVGPDGSSNGGDLRFSYSFAHAESGVTLTFNAGQMGEPELTDLGDIMRGSDYFADIMLPENIGTRRVMVTVMIEDEGSSWQWTVTGTTYWQGIPWFEFNVTAEQAKVLTSFLLNYPDSTLRVTYFILQNGAQEWVHRAMIDARGYRDLLMQSEDMLREVRTTATSEKCLCFLTTACCDRFGRPDDGWELRTLRAFRDGWLARAPGGAAEIARYYQIAPAICDAIRHDPRGGAELRRIYICTILPCVTLIRLRLPGAARVLYRAMVRRLERRYAPRARGAMRLG